MNNFVTRITLAASFALWAGTASAEVGVPVTDPMTLAEVTAVLAETKKELAEAIKANGILDEQTKKLLAQIKQLEQIYASLSNGFELEDLLAGLDLDSLLDDLGIGNLEDQLAAAKSGNWGSVLGDGTIGGSSAQDIVTRIYEDAGLSQDRVTGLSESEDPGDKQLGDQAATNAYTSLAAENAIEQTSASLDRTSQLIGKIPETGGLKEAIDLNSRITAELVIALINQANMEAIQTVAVSQAGVADAATMANDEKFMTISGENSDE